MELYSISGGGRTLVNGTGHEIKFGPSGYIMTLTGFGGVIKYNGVEQADTFEVLPGDSISITITAWTTSGSSVLMAKSVVNLNGQEVAKAMARSGETKKATYVFTPSGNATISRSARGGTGDYQETIKITEE